MYYCYRCYHHHLHSCALFVACRPGEVRVVATETIRKDQLIGVMAGKLQELVGDTCDVNP
jgi:hypothetical protein